MSENCRMTIEAWLLRSFGRRVTDFVLLSCTNIFHTELSKQRGSDVDECQDQGLIMSRSIQNPRMMSGLQKRAVFKSGETQV